MKAASEALSASLRPAQLKYFLGPNVGSTISNASGRLRTSSSRFGRLLQTALIRPAARSAKASLKSTYVLIPLTPLPAPSSPLAKAWRACSWAEPACEPTTWPAMSAGALIESSPLRLTSAMVASAIGRLSAYLA